MAPSNSSFWLFWNLLCEASLYLGWFAFSLMFLSWKAFLWPPNPEYTLHHQLTLKFSHLFISSAPPIAIYIYISSFVGLAQGETTMSVIYCCVPCFHIVPYMNCVLNKCCYNLKNNKVQVEKSSFELGTVAHACNPRTREANEVRLSWVGGQSGLQSVTLSNEEKENKS